MAKIDLYVRSMERFGAAGVVLRSGSNVTLRFPSGDRHATQTTSQAQLQEMVGEVASAEVRASIAGQGRADFEWASDGKRYAVSVLVHGNNWQVSIEPAATSAAAAPAAPVAPPGPPDRVAAAPAHGELPIERTAYAPAPAPTGDSQIPIEPTQHESAPVIEVPATTGDGSDKLIDRLLVAAKTSGASDLHLCTGSPPLVRLSGEIRPIDGFDVFEAEALERELISIAPEVNRLEYAERNDTDFGYSIPGVSRFRANLFRDRKGPGGVFRAIPFEIPTAEQLGVPAGILKLCELTKGLVLVTGPTGSGKSTTLAAMIDYINATRSDHIITIEDPIEFMHPNKKCLINQREVRTHTDSFKDALRAALREDPDIVLVGEMRDLETIAIAIETAETGHLVFGTLHTTTAPGTVDRIIDQFPADRQEQIRTMLSESLKGVVAQVLCRKKGGGRVAVHEVLLGNSAVKNLIRERKTFQLFSIMQTARTSGMQTMNDALLKLVNDDIVEPMEAYRKAANKDEFRNLLQRNGIEL